MDLLCCCAVTTHITKPMLDKDWTTVYDAVSKLHLALGQHLAFVRLFAFFTDQDDGREQQINPQVNFPLHF